jgi:hypothetical protein
MRLTLRTLLAYLDDILEPSHAREIGHKVSESTFATTLTNRIREVMRRRRLGAPDVQGPKQGLSPNVVAEYLDNTLAPKDVPDVERVCLESDTHLAEVAACHQVLTLVLGEPVEVPEASRERMYALGPSPREAEPARFGDDVLSQAPAASDAAPEAAPAAKPAPARSFEETIPAYLRRRSIWRRVAPYALVALVLGVWIGSFTIHRSFFTELLSSWGEKKPAATDAEKGGPAEGKRESPKAPGDSVAALDQDKTRRGAENVTPSPAEEKTDQITEPATDGDDTPPEKVTLTPLENVDPQPPADAPEPEQGEKPVVRVIPDGPVPPAEAEKETKGEDVASNVKPIPDEAAAKADEGNGKPPAPQPPAAPVAMPAIQYTSVSGILLHYEERKNDWFVMPKRAMVHPGDRLAAPEPFEAELDIGKGEGTVMLVGPASVRVAGPSEAAPAGFQISQGRVIFKNTGNEPLTLSLVVQDQLWRLELLAAGTQCGIEFTPKEPDTYEQEVGDDFYTGTLYVTDGSVRLADGTGVVRVIDARSKLSLTPADRAKGDEWRPTPLAGLPEWMDPEFPTSYSDRQYAGLFEKIFEPDLGVQASIPPSMKHSRPRMAELAVECLALTHCYRPLVQALAESDHEESRMVAFHGLRQWLPTDPANRNLLKDELAKRFPEYDAKTVYDLLWGYRPNEVANPTTAQMLVDWLMHDQVIIREMAFYHVYRLTGRKNAYRPLAPEGHRRTAVKRFQNYIDKEGGLLPEKES